MITIWSKGKRVRSQIEVFRRIAAGEYKFCGSLLQYDERKRKWFVLLTYQQPVEHAETDPEKTAYLWPGSSVPFLFRGPGFDHWLWMEGRGWHIADMRQRIFHERRSRSDNYRRVTARKGKGRNHANRWRKALSRKWSEFVKRVNHKVSHDAVKYCVEKGIGRLVYLKPLGVVAENRAISQLGATDRDQSTWEFFQLKTMLSNKCTTAGIQFETKEFDGSGFKKKG